HLHHRPALQLYGHASPLSPLEHLGQPPNLAARVILHPVVIPQDQLIPLLELHRLPGGWGHGSLHPRPRRAGVSLSAPFLGRDIVVLLCASRASAGAGRGGGWGEDRRQTHHPGYLRTGAVVFVMTTTEDRENNKKRYLLLW
ncbi:unnamed protein product, partial [Ectocarpus sp. 8 AP-2014]